MERFKHLYLLFFHCVDSQVLLGAKHGECVGTYCIRWRSSYYYSSVSSFSAMQVYEVVQKLLQFQTWCLSEKELNKEDMWCIKILHFELILT
jgi:hypothetical protein